MRYKVRLRQLKKNGPFLLGNRVVITTINFGCSLFQNENIRSVGASVLTPSSLGIAFWFLLEESLSPLLLQCKCSSEALGELNRDCCVHPRVSKTHQVSDEAHTWASLTGSPGDGDAVVHEPHFGSTGLPHQSVLLV